MTMNDIYMPYWNKTQDGKEIAQLCRVLETAGRNLVSTGCPYLALAEQTGYMTSFVVRRNPSNFGRLSMKKILQTGGFSTKHSQFIFECLENGHTLKETAIMLFTIQSVHSNDRKVVKKRYRENLKKFECV